VRASIEDEVLPRGRLLEPDRLSKLTRDVRGHGA